jgi:predicted NBD/HSP70 family sugar kinase
MYHKVFGPKSSQLHNMNLILEQIKANGPISRADIARNLSCSKSMVTINMEELIRYGLVKEIGKGNSTTGRKSTLLEFNPKSHFVIGADIRPDHFKVIISDLDGNISFTHPFKLRNTNPNYLIPTISRFILLTIERAGIEKTAILSVGMMVSGIVDPNLGIVKYSALLGWHNPVELAAQVQEAVQLPVYVENDVNALALAEYWLYYNRQTISSIAYIYINKGVGGAYISSGAICQGADFAFAEFGKLIISGDQGPASLESYVSFDSLIKRFKIPLKQSRIKALNDYLSINKETAFQLYAFLISCLSQALTIIVAVLNPHIFLLGGGLEFPDNFFRDLIENTRVMLPALPNRTLRIISASLGQEKEALGAAAVALSNTRFKFII